MLKSSMKIVLYCKGSPKDQAFFKEIVNLATRLQIYEQPELSKNLAKYYQQGITGNTILTVNNQVILVDQYPSSTELEALLSDYLK